MPALAQLLHVRTPMLDIAYEAHGPGGEGACSRWGAKRPQTTHRHLAERVQPTEPGAAAQPSGSKLPRHGVIV
ncbi:ribosomal protein L3 [Pseudomonas sp. BIGb0450]|nr:ribosomal protein L3 [Pseudomonas sp. BIGb0558]MCS3439791.1 ribosomal protein L3 [Pseudomonas sp. BIGb0450]